MSTTQPPAHPLRSVILRHTLPDGDWHFDWMLETAPGSSTLLTFRVMVRPDETTAPFEAIRLPDHRSDYLSYQGPVSAGRGEVRRVAHLACELRHNAPDRLLVELFAPQRRILWSGRAVAPGRPGRPGHPANPDPQEVPWHFEPGSGVHD